MLRHMTSATAHLYVAIIGNRSGKVLRYPIVNGLPSKKPDFAYRGVTSPIAVGSDGTLYGTSNACCFCVAHVDVWPPGASKPSRHVKVPWVSSDGAIATSIAVGRGGYLYVGYTQCLSGARARRVAARAAGGTPGNGIAVYAPNQSGGDPLIAYRLPHDDDGPFAIAIGRVGELYVSVSTAADENFIDVVAKPERDPQTVRQISFGYQNVYSLAFDRPERNLFALTTEGRPAAVLVLPPDANGPARPIRTIVLPYGSETLWGGLALDGDRVFSIMTNFSYSDTTIEEFPRGANGSVQPNPIFTYPGHTVAGDLAVGP
jgi:hypothetical protein